jgi:hypothetical protein
MQAQNASATSSLILFLPSSCLAMILPWTSGAQSVWERIRGVG